MSRLLTMLFALFLILPQQGYSAQYVTPPKLDENYQVPDHRAKAETLLQKFKLLNTRSEKLRRNADMSGDVDDLLKNMFLPKDSRQFQAFYRPELAIAKNPKQANLWRTLAYHYVDQGNLQDAATAAFMSYSLDKNKMRQAEALRQMGEVYVEQGKLSDGLNLFSLSLALDRNDETERRLRVIKERFFLTIRDISVNVEQTSPNACVIFSQKIKSGQKPEDYVSLSGINDIDINLQGNQICLNGLDYGKSYEVNIKQGLKGDKNTLLDHDSTRKFTVNDRESRTTFEKDSYVISRTKDNVVPLTTVNVKKLKLELFLIHDRNLIQGTAHNLFEGLNGYRSDTIQHEQGSLIWQGEIDINDTPNKEVKTLLPLNDMIKTRENGIYILVAREPKKDDEPSWRFRNHNHASQWLLVSDMGLMTFQGKDGLHVMVRSLEKAGPIKNIKVNLIARNNKILGTATTDRKGMAHFPEGLIRGKGGDAPALITAERKQDDYNFLKLENSYLDLGDRGVSGRTAPGRQDAFLYTDRGVYRPGETVKLSSLLRDPESKAIGNLPLTFRVNKPDGSSLIEKNISGDDLGGYALDIPLSASSIPGHYHVTAYLTKASESLGSVSFQVEDFVPQRIRARISSLKKWLPAGSTTEFSLKANFLYGPPAAGLKTESHISLQRNQQPYPNYPDYHFGLVEEDFYSKSLSPITTKTDEEGQSLIPVTLNDLPDTTQPMLAYLQSFVFDVSGRPVDAKIAVPLRPREVEIGLKRSFNGTLSAGDEVNYEVVALDRNGKAVPNRIISYELVKEDYYYSWYRSGDYWNSRRHMSDSMVETGEITTDGKGLAHISHRAADGRYRLNILDKKGSSAASNRYYVGWWSSGSLPNVPDELELSLKNKAFNDGETLTAFVKAPFAGLATIMIMNDKLRLSREITLPKEGREISVKVDKNWGPGAYLMVSAFRPEAGKISKLPVRAMNLAWFSIDQEKRQAVVKIDVPETVTPRQTITLPVTLEGNNVTGQRMKLTIAAVDEGILGLTNFNSPDPLNHFLSQRRLGMSLADLYGRLIKPVEGIRGQLRTGGDMARMLSAPAYAEAAGKAKDENATGVQTKTVKTVALYERDIEFDTQGKAHITLDLPDYNGRLRLMAVAYGDEIIAQGDQELIVLDPVVADLLLPRFLSPGDQAETTLSIHNLSGKDRSFTIELGHATGLDIPGEKSLSITLANNQRFEKTIPLRADKVGNSTLSLTVTTDGLPDIKRQWDIAVRPAQPFTTKRQVTYLAPGDHKTLTHEDIKGYLESTLSANLTLTDKPDYNVPDLLDSLYLYPYACGEQTTSRVLPLLYYGDVANSWNATYDPLKIRRVIDKAIRHLLDLQRHDGSFALWRSTGESHPWLTAYIFEFLSRAKEQGIEVPTAAYDHTRQWLKNLVNRRNGVDAHVTAYAYYALARIGDVKPSDIRYFADNNWDKIETKLGLGQLAAALKLIGENHMSEEFFLRALKKNRATDKKWVWYKDFGSDLRDSAALAALMAESSSGDVRALRVADAIDREFDQREFFSTQEKAWLLLATHSMSETSKDGFQISLNHKELPLSMAPLRYNVKPEAILQGFDIANIGKPNIRAIQSIRAVPAAPLKPVTKGFEINRTFLTLEGRPVDLTQIKQNDMLIVSIQGQSENSIDHEALIVDMLPAGFEIENAAIGGFEAEKQLDFLPQKSHFLYEAARDDRYIAALNLSNYSRKFATYYIVRAITPGTYQLPAIFIEDMYKPEYHARGSMGSITIGK